MTLLLFLHGKMSIMPLLRNILAILGDSSMQKNDNGTSNISSSQFSSPIVTDISTVITDSAIVIVLGMQIRNTTN